MVADSAKHSGGGGDFEKYIPLFYLPARVSATVISGEVTKP